MASLKKLKADYEFGSIAYADVAVNADLKDNDWVRDIAQAAYEVTRDAFDAYLDELKNQEKIKRTREALDQVMETIAPTETPFLAIPNPLMKEHADPIDIMIENKSGSLNIDLLNKDHEMKQKIKQKHMMGILLHRHPCTSAQMAEKLAMHVDEARPLLEKLFKGGQIAVAKVYDKPSQKRASYRLWAAKSNDFKPAEVEQSL